jgi:class 3 adenylate cyclase
MEGIAMEGETAVTRRLSGEFTNGACEGNYRAQQMAAEVRQIRLTWVMALGFFLIYGPVDYWLFGRELAAQLLAPRAAILAVGSLAVLATLTAAGRARRDVIGFVALALVAVSYAQLLDQRDSGLGSPGALMLLVVGIYMFSPGRYWMVCSNAILCSVASALALLDDLSVEHGLQFSYLIPANIIAALALGQLNRLRRLSFLNSERLREEVSARQQAQHALARLHARTRDLLHNALPETIARQLQDDPGRRPAREHAMATVMFADLVGFSTLSRQLSPAQLLALLNSLFSAFDDLAAEFGLQKIKTVGDAYMAVAGVSQPEDQQQQRAAGMALALVDCCDAAAREQGLALRLRIGIHSGPLVAGVIGRQRLAYDIWGETVNIASRLQTAAAPGRILVSRAVRQACSGQFLFGRYRSMELRGCGRIRASTLYSRLSVL